MALGRTVGRVSVRVSPDSTGFARELRTVIAEAERQRVNLKVKLDLDAAQLRTQLAALRGTAVEIKADIDAEKIKAKLAAMRLNAKVELRADLTRLRSELAGVRDVNVRLKADFARFRRELNAVTRRQRLTINVDGDFGRFLAQLRAVQSRAARNLELNVRLDTTGAMARFKVLWRRMQAYALANPIPMRFDIDRNHITRMVSSAFSGVPSLIGRIFGGLGGSGGGGPMGSVFASLQAGAQRLGPYLAALGAAVQAVIVPLAYLVAGVSALYVAVGVAKALGDLIGVLGMLPALLFAAGAGLGVLGLGFLGIKKNAGNAKKAADAVKSLADEFASLRDTVSDKLFAGMDKPLQRLGTTVIPALKTGLGGVAVELNRMGRGMLDFLESKKGLADLNTSLKNTKPLFRGIGEAVVSMQKALSDITVVGSSFFPALGKSISGAANDFARFIAEARKSGQLAAWIQSGVDAMQSLWRIAGNVKSAITGLFAPADAGSFLTNVEKATKAVSDFINSAKGQEAFTNLFNGLKQGWAAVASSITADDIVNVLNAIANTLIATGAVVNIIISQFQLFAAAIQWVKEAAAAFVGAIDQSVETIVGFSESTGGLIASLPEVVSWLLQATAAVQTWVSQLTLVNVGTTLATAAMTMFGQMVSAALTLVSTAFTLFSTTTMTVWAAVVATFQASAAMVVAVLTAMSASASAVWAAIVATISGASSTVVALISSMGARGGALFRAFLSVARSVTSQMRSSVTSLISSMVSTVAGVLGRLPGIASAAFGAVRSAASSMLNAALSIARSVVSGIISAFSRLPGALASAGANAFSGFIAGLRSRAGAAIAAARSIASQVAAAARSALAIRSPSRVFMEIGRYSAEGLALGLLQGRDKASSASRALTDSILSSPDFPGSTIGGDSMGGQTINFHGNVGWEPNEVARRISTRQRDDLVMAGLAGGFA